MAVAVQMNFRARPWRSTTRSFRSEDAERFVEEVRGDDPELAPTRGRGAELEVGERSLLAALAFLPLLVAVGFGLAELFA